MNEEHDDGPVTFGPGMPPRDPGKVARQLMLEARKAAIVQRVGLEVRSLFEGLQEATRTAGVVLAVLRIVDLYPAPWWVICTFLAGPFLVNVSVLALAWVWRPRVLR